MRTLLVLMMFCALAGCEKNRIYERNVPLRHHQWGKNEPVEFEVNISDTAATYDLFVNVRHRANFKAVNLWMRVFIGFPDGDSLRFEENVLLGDNTRGRWLGDCVADVCDLQHTVASGVRLRQQGTHRFALFHLMWEDPLESVMSVGLRLEKSEATGNSKL